ncbi:MAG TPA: type II toxin-antitoxin system PemK/MazF family toxin, partial [Steroidobacteraceae bacterium]|nr:type II toxin-antitoxin system PemK/MazF family toxin [Steroidobacteraceae bacterium]
AIEFPPRPGMVLICDFRGSIAPEIPNFRPVVVISPFETRRAYLSTIVPLSTKRPAPVHAYHYRLRYKPFENAADEIWAKCDLVMSVSQRRLDRVRLAPHRHVIGVIGTEELMQIRLAAALSFGVDLSGLDL